MVSKRGHIWRVIRNSPGVQILIYFIAFAMLIALYTYIFHLYYPVLENKPLSWMQALLFVADTMTTVGYGDLLPFTNDMTMLLAIQIMISGVIMIFIVVPLLLAPFLTSLLAPTPPTRIPHVLHGHTVIFGYDQLTHSVIDSLMIADHDIVIIEQEKATALGIATQYRHRAYVVWGEYADPGTWAAAHLSNAHFVVICKDERQTANIVLGIRGMVAGKIIAVVDKLMFEPYLRYAGADYVISPKQTTGIILARNAILVPESEVIRDIPGISRVRISLSHEDEQEFRLINIPVVPGCCAVSQTLGELDLLKRFGILVPFLWKGGTFIQDPGSDIVIDGTTSLFLFGRAASIVVAIQQIFNIDGYRDSQAVIAGFGDVGAAAFRELSAAGVSCTVVDAKPQVEGQVVGSAEDIGVLKKAGIENARFCIVALNDDSVNIFTTLMARNINPAVRILSRANEPASVEKLYRAGADHVALLPTIGGQTIARIVLEGSATVILNLPDGKLVVMKRISVAHPGTISQYFHRTGTRIIGIESASRSIVSPGPEEVLHQGDEVVAIGDTDQLKRFIHQI